MGGFAVVSMDESVGKYRLSVMCPSPVEVFVSENLYVNAFKKNAIVVGDSCGGCLYFHNEIVDGHSFICNLKTKKIKVLTRPNFLPPPNEGFLNFSGLGYDAKSGDFKVVRQYLQLYFDRSDMYLGDKTQTELYSSKDDRWKEINEPVGCFCCGVGVFVGETGSCYWVVSVSPAYPEIEDYLKSYSVVHDPQDCFRHVLSFDFAAESFKLFPLPPPTTRGATFELVKVRGSLGALAYWKSSDSELSIKLFVLEGTSWEVLYDDADVPPLVDVERPLGLKDDRWLFVEAKASDGAGQLMVYDLYTKVSKKFDIKDRPGRMYGISYDAESIDPPLPGSTPITNDYFSKVSSGSS